MESELVAGYLHKGKDKYKHLWVQYNIEKYSFVIECDYGGRILKRSNLPKNFYVSVPRRPYLLNKINEFEKRSGIKLKVKDYKIAKTQNR